MLISSLLFLALASRPDITFAVIKLAKFASNPSNNHFQVIKRVFEYLKKNFLRDCLLFKSKPLPTRLL